MKNNKHTPGPREILMNKAKKYRESLEKISAMSVEERRGKIYVVSNYKDITLCEM